MVHHTKGYTMTSYDLSTKLMHQIDARERTHAKAMHRTEHPTFTDADDLVRQMTARFPNHDATLFVKMSLECIRSIHTLPNPHATIESFRSVLLHRFTDNAKTMPYVSAMIHFLDHAKNEL